MIDHETNLSMVKQMVKQFIEEREWNQFHDPKNLSMLIATEAAELMELFRWTPNTHAFEQCKNNREAVEQEIADIFFGILTFCVHTNIDLSTVLENKIKLNALRYPIEKSKGSTKKYTDFDK